jgi:hypothetical protein
MPPVWRLLSLEINFTGVFLKDEWIEYKLLHKEIEMKLKRIAAMVAVLILCLSSLTFTADKEEKEPIKHLETDAEKMSYTLGLDTGKRLKSLPIEVDLTIFLKGVEDTIKENKLLLTPEEAEEMMAKIRQKVMAKEIEQMMKQAEKNLKEGEAFLAENGKKRWRCYHQEWITVHYPSRGRWPETDSHRQS